MKLNDPITKKLRIINKVSSLPTIHISKRNNDSNINNISSTTNASAIKNTINNSILIPNQTKKYRLLKKIKLNNNANKSMLNNIDSKNIFHSTKNINQKTIQILEKGDLILKERKKLHDLAFSGNKNKMKKVYLNISKDISLKNYTIELLKKRRTKINEKEYLFNKALKEFDEQYEEDHKNFNSFVEKIKNKEQKDERYIYHLKEINEQKEKEVEEEINLRKILEKSLEKQLKDLYIVKGYGEFFHKIVEKPFAYKMTPKLSTRLNNYDRIAKLLINIYETQDKYNMLPKELEDEDIILKKYKLLEDGLLINLKYKQNLGKQIEEDKLYYENELKELKLSLNDYQNDLNYLKNEKNIINKDFSNYIINKDNKFGNYLKDIFEFGKELDPNIEVPVLTDKIISNDILVYIKTIKENLKNIEIKINNNISEIEKVLEFGEKEDKMLMSKIILHQKKMNKLENILSSKQLKEKIKHLKDLKIVEKSKKIVVKGRKIIFDYPFKKKSKMKRLSNLKNNEEIELDYSYTEDEA